MRFHSRTFLYLCFCLVFASGLANAADWPCWRGPHGDGHSDETNIPVKWNSSSIRWKCGLPGEGQSSPSIFGDKIFLTSALENGKQRIVLCVNRQTGKIEWDQVVWKGEPEKTHAINGWASSTCATDGERVIAFFGKGGLHCFDMDGKKQWSKDLGSFEGPWGTGASPIIVDNLVVQNCEAEVDAKLMAFDKHTGDVVWSVPRDIPDKGGWSTPVLIETPGRREIVLNGFYGVTSFEPTTGKQLWFCKSFAGRGEPTATPSDGRVFLINGLSGDAYAVRLGGTGDVTRSHMAWHTARKAGRDQPSPIVIDRFVLVASMDGILCCYDAEKGTELWKDRIVGKFTSSPIAANGLAYFQSDGGDTYVIKPGRNLEVASQNSIPTNDEIFRASLAPSGGEMFSRSNKTLYCLDSVK
jgi:outer membrane protein assembly factor BamB